MDRYILKVNCKDLTLPIYQKPGSRNFPRAKIRITPKSRSSIPEMKISPPFTPKLPTAYNFASLLMMNARISPSIPKTPTHANRNSISQLSKSWRNASPVMKNQKFQGKSPTKMLTIPLSSLKLL